MKIVEEGDSLKIKDKEAHQVEDDEPAMGAHLSGSLGQDDVEDEDVENTSCCRHSLREDGNDWRKGVVEVHVLFPDPGPHLGPRPHAGGGSEGLQLPRKSLASTLSLPIDTRFIFPTTL